MAEVQVYSPRRKLDADVIIENGLLRYILAGNRGFFYVYDSVTASPKWVCAGEWETYLTGPHKATVAELSIVRLNGDVIEWRERRHYDDDEIQILYELRRGAQYCRIEMTTTSQTINDATYVAITNPGCFLQLFNSTANGAAGAGNLAQDASHCYECGYKTTANIVSGFALCDQPTYQPYDPGAAGNYLPLSLTFTTSQTRVFAFIGWAQDTSAFNLANGRANASYFALQALYSLEQRTVIKPKALVMSS